MSQAAPTRCGSKVSKARGAVVIASCADNLTWAAAFAGSSWDVTVLEKCRSEREDTHLTGVRTIHLRPNLGREAHSYLHYIVENYEQLAPATVFLQGDAPRHISLERALRPHDGDLDTFVRDCWSYLSLVPIVHPAAFRTSVGIPLSTFCALWRSFTSMAHGACPLWGAAAWASFVVSRRTIRLRPKEAYARWRHSFEDAQAARALWGPSWLSPYGPPREPPTHRPSSGPAGGHARAGSATHDMATEHGVAARVGATFFERAWTLIFGCTEALSGCSFAPEDSRQALFARCPMMELKSPLAPKPNQPRGVARLYKLVRNESSVAGCRGVHRLAHQTVNTSSAGPSVRRSDPGGGESLSG